MHTVFFKIDQIQNLTLTTEPWKWGQVEMTPGSWTCTPFNHSLHQIYYSTLIDYNIWVDLTTQTILVHVSMKWGQGQFKWKLSRHEGCARYAIPNKVILLYTHNNREINIIQGFFSQDTKCKISRSFWNI